MPILHWIVNYLISAHVDTLILTFLEVYRFKILMYELVDDLMISSRPEERIIKYARRGMLPRGFNFIVWGKLITDYEKLFKLMFFFSFLFFSKRVNKEEDHISFKYLRLYVNGLLFSVGCTSIGDQSWLVLVLIVPYKFIGFNANRGKPISWLNEDRWHQVYSLFRTVPHAVVMILQE